MKNLVIQCYVLIKRIAAKSSRYKIKKSKNQRCLYCDPNKEECRFVSRTSCIVGIYHESVIMKTYLI
jgi:hypothetical protein